MTAMYLDYFGLAEPPFTIAPAPRYLYMSQRHQEALAHLIYGVNGDGGFVLLTGEVGTGKTTICRSLLEQLPDTCDVAYIFNPRLTVEELLSTLCVEFGIEVPPENTSNKVFVDRINAHLLDLHARGRHAVLIIDEAQNLSAEVLEQMRLLTNLETSERKLLRIILLGQPELAAMLARPELRQLAQRIVARYHLGSLTQTEVAAYIRHRLEVAGTQRPLFPPAVVRQVYRLSGGIPRLINIVCDRALLGAYVEGKERVDRATLAKAAREVIGRSGSWRPGIRQAFAAGVLLLASGALAWAVYRQVPFASEAALTHAVATTPAALSDSLEWPADVARSNSEALAYAALFRAWGADYQGGDFCRQATAQGLHCRSGRGGLDELHRLNRPAVLRLLDRQGQAFDATLVALAPDSATLSVGGKTRTIALKVLATYWAGRYDLLWRAPPAVQGTLRPGDRGPAAAWLRARVAELHGREVDATAAPVFDAALVSEIKQFQLDQGLIPDGCVGSQTLTRLVSATDRTGPRLAGTGR